MLKSTLKNKMIQKIAIVGLVSLSTACKVLGPDYVPPSSNPPEKYKEATKNVDAQLVANAISQHWWEIYDDAELNKLLEQLEAQNYSLKDADAKMRQARAVSDAVKAEQYPTLVAGGKNDIGLLVNWEIDLWGRVQRSIEASGANAQASEADLAAIKLSQQAQLAQTYFLLRVQDAQIHLLQNTVSSYERSLQMARNQYAAGVVDKGNVMQAQAQHSAAIAQMHDARVTRSQLEHAIAVLIGKAPADFSIQKNSTMDVKVPDIPEAMPADLLVRRPDIAAAERRVAAASAKIGIAEAAAYPSLDLFAGLSINNGVFGGAEVIAPLYPEATPQAMRTGAQGAYDEAVATYHQTVLNGFKEVEDNLTALGALNEAASAQLEATTSAREALTISNNQYKAGIVNYQSVIMTQTTALNNERTVLSILGRRLVASVSLIKALGGGWQSDLLKETEKPKAKKP